MENRYLFRGYGTEIFEWHYGYLYRGGKGEYLISYENSDVEYVVDEKTIGQCTGLKDKNGKMIFEGDIIFDGYSKSVVKFGMYIYIIERRMNDDEIDMFGWYVEFFDKSTSPFTQSKHEKIIGNIHDNPGLLEVK